MRSGECEGRAGETPSSLRLSGPPSLSRSPSPPLLASHFPPPDKRPNAFRARRVCRTRGTGLGSPEDRSHIADSSRDAFPPANVEIGWRGARARELVKG